MDRFLRGRSELIWERECERWDESPRNCIFSPDFLLWVLDLPDAVELCDPERRGGRSKMAPDTMVRRLTLGEGVR